MFMNAGKEINVGDRNVVSASMEEAQDYLVTAAVEGIRNYARWGNDLVIELASGGTLRINNFFINGSFFHRLILVDKDARVYVDFSHALVNGGDGIEDSRLLYQPVSSSSSVKALLGIIGGVTVGTAGIIALACKNETNASGKIHRSDDSARPDKSHDSDKSGNPDGSEDSVKDDKDPPVPDDSSAVADGDDNTGSIPDEADGDSNDNTGSVPDETDEDSDSDNTGSVPDGTDPVAGGDDTAEDDGEEVTSAADDDSAADAADADEAGSGRDSDEDSSEDSDASGKPGTNPKDDVEILPGDFDVDSGIDLNRYEAAGQKQPVDGIRHDGDGSSGRMITKVGEVLLFDRAGSAESGHIYKDDAGKAGVFLDIHFVCQDDSIRSEAVCALLPADLSYGRGSSDSAANFWLGDGAFLPHNNGYALDILLLSPLFSA